MLALMMLCISNASAAPGAFIDVNLNGVYDVGIDNYTSP